MSVALRFAAFVAGAVIVAVIVALARSRRGARPVPQYEAVIARSGADGFRRNPCDVDGCLIRLGTRCAECGVTLYDCELTTSPIHSSNFGCANCGSTDVVCDPLPAPDVSDFPDLEIER